MSNAPTNSDLLVRQERGPWAFPRLRRPLLALAVIAAGATCVPIQSTRVDTVLHYRQVYNLGALKGAPRSCTARYADRFLQALVGRRNYCMLYQGGLTRDAAVKSLFRPDSQWDIQGLATAVVLPSPWNSDRFYVEAQGRYNVYSHGNQDLLIATADFHVDRQSVQSFASLLRPRTKDDLNWIDLRVSQVVLREVNPTGSRYVYEGALVLRLYVKILDREGVFAIADRPQEIGILSEDGTSAYSMGCVTFTGPMDGRKIFDIRQRGSWMLKNDYRAVLEKNGLQESHTAFAPHWFGPRCQEVYLREPWREGSEWDVDSNAVAFEKLFPEAPHRAECEEENDVNVEHAPGAGSSVVPDGPCPP